MPALIFNLLVKPTLDYTKAEEDFKKIDLFIRYAFPLYLFRIVIELLFYNTILTATTAKLSALDNNELSQATADYKEEKEKLCGCSQADKIRTIVRSPLYYASNHLFASGIDFLVNPIVGKLLKVNIYGRALAENYLDNSELCVEHKRLWLSQRNFLCLGIGLSFTLMHSFCINLINSLIYLISPIILANFDILSSFILNDSIFNVLWFVFTSIILTNPSILKTSTEYTFDLYKYSNTLALKGYNTIKEKTKTLVKQQANNPSVIATVGKYYKKLNIHELIYYLLPTPLRSPDEFIKTKPVQLFIYINRQNLLEVTRWLETINRAKPVVVGSGILGGKGLLKKILNRWFPETSILILFELIVNDTFSESNTSWLSKHIKEAKPGFSDSFFLKFLRKKFGLHDFIVVPEERSLPVVTQRGPISIQEFYIDNPTLTISPPSPVITTQQLEASEPISSPTLHRPVAIQRDSLTRHSSWEVISESPTVTMHFPGHALASEETQTHFSHDGQETTRLPHEARNDEENSDGEDHDWMTSPRETVSSDSIDEHAVKMVSSTLILPYYRRNIVTPNTLTREHFPKPRSNSP